MLALFPEIATRAKDQDLEGLSVYIRRYFGGTEGDKPKLDIDLILATFGIPLGEHENQTPYKGALAVRDVKGRIDAKIQIRGKLPAVERSFLLCHLLGHFVLQVQPELQSGDWTSSGFRDDLDPLDRYLHGSGSPTLSLPQMALEDLADRFAAALLMPRAMMLRAVEKNVTVERIATLFGVTPRLAARRIQEIQDQKMIDPHAVAGGDPKPMRSVVSPRNESTGLPPEQMISTLNQPLINRTTLMTATSYHNKGAPTLDENEERSSSEQPKRGMDRIREIAMKLDRAGDKTK